MEPLEWSIKLRLAAIAMAVLVAGVVLAPSFWSSSGISDLHDLRVTLPVEFTGGTELTLVVELDDVIRAARDDHVRYFREIAHSHGLDVDGISALGTWEIEVTSSEPSDRLEAFLNQYLGPYNLVESKSGRHIFALSKVRRDEISRNAVKSAIQVLSGRLCGHGMIQQVGDRTLQVRLPPDWSIDQVCW